MFTSALGAGLVGLFYETDQPEKVQKLGRIQALAFNISHLALNILDSIVGVVACVLNIVTVRYFSTLNEWHVVGLSRMGKLPMFCFRLVQNVFIRDVYPYRVQIQANQLPYSVGHQGESQQWLDAWYEREYGKLNPWFHTEGNDNYDFWAKRGVALGSCCIMIGQQIKNLICLPYFSLLFTGAAIGHHWHRLRVALGGDKRDNAYWDKMSEYNEALLSTLDLKPLVMVHCYCLTIFFSPPQRVKKEN